MLDDLHADQRIAQELQRVVGVALGSSRDGGVVREGAGEQGAVTETQAQPRFERREIGAEVSRGKHGVAGSPRFPCWPLVTTGAGTHCCGGVGAGSLGMPSRTMVT